MNQISQSLASAPAPKGSFVTAARAYKRLLGQTVVAAESRNLWRSTSLPYVMTTTDPFSNEYRQEVRTVYTDLTGLDYDVGAELTSTKQDEKQFQIGHPWTSRDVGTITQELSKAVQALQALHVADAKGRIIEFGAGWGNLALPLARSGFAVTTVDIDPGFNARLQRLAAEQHTVLDTFEGNFLDASTQITGPFETIIFQSSFHHCLEFDQLLANITERLLDASGRILFLSEPILPDLAFPWGIRYDGEALWAVMCNGWLELGFQHDFFLKLLFRHGLLATRVPGLSGMVGDGWSATRAELGLPFADLALPSAYDATFHPIMGSTEWGRYCRRRSRLPGAGTSACMLLLKNFGVRPMNIEFRNEGRTVASLTIQSQQSEEVNFPTTGADTNIISDVFVPNSLMGNGDTREIGLAVLNARWLSI